MLSVHTLLYCVEDVLQTSTLTTYGCQHWQNM